MGRGLWRVSPLVLVLGLVVAACGGDEDGEVGLSTTTSAGSVTTLVGETTTTEAWGVAVDPGVEAMVGGSGVLLREDFQDGDALGWQVEAGWYVLANGQRRMAAAGGEAWAWYAEGLGWSRYGVRLAFLAQQGPLGVSVAVGQGGRYVVQLSEDGVFLLRDAPYGSVQALGSAQPVEAGVPHVLAVGVDGGHLQVYVDGVLLIDATDGSPLPGGSIGLGAGDEASVVVDNIVVASLGGPLPEIEAVGEPADEPLPEELADAGPQAGEELEAEEPAEPGFPNLVLRGVSVPPGVQLGEAFDVSMSVANTGDADAGAFTVLFILDWCEAEVESLRAGEETTVSCQWPGYANWAGEVEWNAWADSGEVIDEGGREADNVIYGTSDLGDVGQSEEVLPNLHLSWWDMVPSYEAVPVGEPMAMTFQIQQSESAWQGHMSTFTVDVLYEDGSTVCHVTVGSPDFGGSCELPAFEASGEHWLQVVTDSGDAVRESDEDDNLAAIWVIVLSADLTALPNLYVSGIEFNPVLPRAGEPFEMTIDMMSNADDLPLYTIRLLIDDVVVCSVDDSHTSAGYICDIPALSAGVHRWAAYVDADNDIAESDEADNNAFGEFGLEG